MIRKTMRCVLPVVALAVISLFAPHRPAYAYIDPGTGGMLLQLLLGGVVGALVVIKLYWFRLRQTVKRLFGGKTKPEKAETD